jgi:hypothetical protein
MSRNGPPKSGIGSKTDEGMGMTIVRLFNPTRIPITPLSSTLKKKKI